MTRTQEFQANLDRIFDPLNRASERHLQLTLADVAREQALKDEERRNIRQERLMDKQAEAEDKKLRARRALDIAISMGIEIPANASDEQIARLVKDRKEQIANNALKQTKSIYDADRNNIAQRRKQLDEKRDDIIDNSLTPLQKAEILKTVLAAPEFSSALRKDSKNKVDQLLKIDLSRAKDADVDSLVNSIYTDIKSNKFLFWGKGGEKVANAFNEAYQSLAGEKLMASKQVAYADWVEQSKDLSRESQVIERGRSDALKEIVKQHGAFLGDDTIEKITKEMTPAMETQVRLPPSITSKIAEVGMAPKGQPQAQVIEPEFLPEGSDPNAIAEALGARAQSIPPSQLRDEASKTIARRVSDYEQKLKDLGVTVGDDGKISVSELGREVNVPAPYFGYFGVGPSIGGSTQRTERTLGDIQSAKTAAGPILEKLQADRKLLSRLNPVTAPGPIPLEIPQSMTQLTPHNAAVSSVVTRMTSKPEEQPYPLTLEAMEAVTKLAIEKYDAPPAEAAQFFEKVKAGDRAAISTWNTLYEEAHQDDAQSLALPQ